MSSALKSSTLKLSVFIWLTLNNHLAQTIFYLQEQGFIHKDMKHEADNVLISYLKNEYHVILTDFGKCVELTAAGSLVKHFHLRYKTYSKGSMVTLLQKLYVVPVLLHILVTCSLLGEWPTQLTQTFNVASFVLWEKSVFLMILSLDCNYVI